MADEGVPLGERRRDHRVVDARPLDRGHHRPARLDRGGLHRRRRQQPGRDEVEVRDAGGGVRRLVDDRPEADAERRHVENGVDEARPDRPAPDPLVLREPVLVRAQGLEDALHVSPRACGRSDGGRRPRACSGGRASSAAAAPARRPRPRSRRRRACRGGRGPAAPRRARRRPRRPHSRAARPRTGSRRPPAWSSAGSAPTASLRRRSGRWSMTTSRSQSCSASSM